MRAATTSAERVYTHTEVITANSFLLSPPEKPLPNEPIPATAKVSEITPPKRSSFLKTASSRRDNPLPEVKVPLNLPSTASESDPQTRDSKSALASIFMQGSQQSFPFPLMETLVRRSIPTSHPASPHPTPASAEDPFDLFLKSFCKIGSGEHYLGKTLETQKEQVITIILHPEIINRAERVDKITFVFRDAKNEQQSISINYNANSEQRIAH